MYSVGPTDALVIVILVWLGTLSYFFWKERRFLAKVFPEKIEGEGAILLREKFEGLLKAIKDTRQSEEALRKNLRDMNLLSLGYIQKVKVLRYNPYQDLGGNVSFSLAILDGKDNGVLVTSLHTRAGTRIYAKEVAGGKSELNLSKEEKEVLEKAVNEKID